MRDNISRKIGLQRPLRLLLPLQSRCQHLAPRCRAHCCSRIRKAQRPLHSLGLRQCRLLRLSCRLGLWLFPLRRLARPRLVLICLASLERPKLRGLPRRSPIRSCQQRFIVISPRLIHVFVSTFCMGMLTWFLCCRGHLQTRIPCVLVLHPHWHAELDPELALRQPGLVNSRLHALRHLVMVAPCPIRPLLFGRLQRRNLPRIIQRCHFRRHVHIAFEDHDVLRAVFGPHQRGHPRIKHKGHEPWFITFPATQTDVWWDL